MSKPSSNRRTLAILAFHKIGEPAPGGWPTWFYIPKTILVDQLSYLERHDWRVLDAAALVEGLRDPERLPERAAVLTFDDGYRSFMEVAVPCLSERGYPAILFVPTDFVGRDSVFDDNEPREQLCGWRELRALGRHGVSVQSHGASHRGFSRLSRVEQEDELSRSRTTLQEQLGTPIDVFAFPYGDGGTSRAVVRRLLEETGYRAACLYTGGRNDVPVGDPYRLLRVPMGPDTDLAEVLAPGASVVACGAGQAG